ncbi:MAG: hypothetical protein AAGJ38_04440 [Planctomycetota bacterium]
MEPRFHFSKPPWMTLLWWLDRWRVAVFVVLGVVYACGMNGRWRITSDSAWYVMLARDGGGPGEAMRSAVGVGATPPGLSWLIAATGGEAGWGTALVMLAIAAGVLVITYRMFVEHADRPTAVLMTTVLGLSGLFMEMTYGLLTELPFMLGLVLLLWGHERRMNRRGPLGLALGMMLLGVAWMAMFRSVVAVVIGAYVLAEVIHVIGRRDQRRPGLALIGLAGASAVVLWSVSTAIRDDVVIFFNVLTIKPPEAWMLSVRMLATEALPEAIFGQDVPPSLAWPASALIVLAGLLLVRTRLLWGVLFGVFVLQWVVFLSDPRYVLPILPLAFFGLWRCGVGVLSKWPEPWRGIGFGLGVLAMFGANVVAVVNVVGEQRSGDFYADYRSSKFAGLVALAEVIREQTPHDAVLVVVPNIGLELAVLSGRVWIVGEAPPEAALFLVGPPSVAFEQSWLSPKWDAVSEPLGSVVDERSGETWELRRVEPRREAGYD